MPGLELSEALPAISDYNCVRSAIGQGTNSFTPAQLARYVSTIANSGKCYELTLVDKIANIADNNIYKKKPNLSNTIDFSSSTWNYIHEGMRKVVTGGSVESLFEGVEIEVAGKTGTAQENDYKPNHALFVSYAPYDDPEISLTVGIDRKSVVSGKSVKISLKL